MIKEKFISHEKIQYRKLVAQIKYFEKLMNRRKLK
jgi:hypothetical protein|tara:strand:+ start:569 stop:673 length:105 start_codon:yes stop_codon:yes gene_type:complete